MEKHIMEIEEKHMRLIRGDLVIAYAVLGDTHPDVWSVYCADGCGPTWEATLHRIAAAAKMFAAMEREKEMKR